jgi:ABC-type transporter Mla maintaining outer membrane lipid asymmetry permease subunit MlaE
VVRLAGSWEIEDGLPAMTEFQQQLDVTPRVRRLIFDAHDLTAWDSGTMGLPPMEFLVLPRMLALMLMIPVLCVYADLVGMLAGLLVSTTLLHMPLMEYLNETRRAVHLVDCGIGVCKSVVFGALVALAGCLCGMQSGRSAAAVGAAATAAVVTGIVWIIASDGMFMAHRIVDSVVTLAPG